MPTAGGLAVAVVVADHSEDQSRRSARRPQSCECILVAVVAEVALAVSTPQKVRSINCCEGR